MVEELKVLKDASVVDVGCGNGVTLVELARLELQYCELILRIGKARVFKSVWH